MSPQPWFVDRSRVEAPVRENPFVVPPPGFREFSGSGVQSVAGGAVADLVDIRLGGGEFGRIALLDLGADDSGAWLELFWTLLVDDQAMARYSDSRFRLLRPLAALLQVRQDKARIRLRVRNAGAGAHDVWGRVYGWAFDRRQAEGY